VSGIIRKNRAMSEYYENKVAVVTGGASGIGLALGELLLSCGAKAVILADLNAEKLKQEWEALEGIHPGKPVAHLTSPCLQNKPLVVFLRGWQQTRESSLSLKPIVRAQSTLSIPIAPTRWMSTS
jgi:hypothetical protein